ncbi:hypothetical protein ACR720_04650 [Sphingomonas parapaucimobilis]|uniref:hypothetical protein n=1 Tax=Sphingomonas parapaucimobilis TaxID=28213 RepID=UPI0039E8997E
MSPDIPIANAVLCWTGGRHSDTPACKVISFPDEAGLSDAYESFVGACFANWDAKSTVGKQLQLMVDAWKIAAFDKVPVDMVHEALLVVPEYRSTLADGCLPPQYLHERA